MDKFVRVKQKGTGHHVSLSAAHVEAANRARPGTYTIITEGPEADTDRPLPPKYNTPKGATPSTPSTPSTPPESSGTKG